MARPVIATGWSGRRGSVGGTVARPPAPAAPGATARAPGWRGTGSSSSTTSRRSASSSSRVLRPGRLRPGPRSRPARPPSRSSADPPAAILCDHRMAGMSGIDFHDAVMAANPELGRRFAFMSGDVLNPELRAFAAERGVRLLAKPFDIAAIGATVRRLLGPRADRRGRITHRVRGPAQPRAAARSAPRVGVEPAARSSGRDGPPRRARRGPAAGRSAPAREPSCRTRMIPRQTSRPMKSASSSGPIGWFSPTCRARVDVLGRPEALLVGPHRLGEERHEDPVDDEPRAVGRDDDLLAHLGRELDGPPPPSRRWSPSPG